MEAQNNVEMAKAETIEDVDKMSEHKHQILM